jgi:hypothetical protein
MYIKRKIMNFETLMRAESVVTKLNILELREAIQSITDQMLEDGFEYSDVKEFLQVEINEILGE